MSEPITDVDCINCGTQASEMFDVIPEYVFQATVWYCCHACYEEYTQHEG
jgi:hypothetical protein